MKRETRQIPAAGKINFWLTGLLIALLTTAFSLNVFGQTVDTRAVSTIPDAPKGDDTKVKSKIRQEKLTSDELSFAPEVAQASSYVFATTTTGSLTDMSSGTTTLVAANQDDTASSVVNIGFDFYFQGVRYTQFSANSNGSIRLGATVNTNTGYNPLGVAGAPIIAPYGADQRTHTTGLVRFKVTGAAGSRILIVEFLNMQADFNSGGTVDLNYQARLYETTGVIEFVYGSMTMSAAGAADANSNSPEFGFSSSNTAGTVGSITAAQSGTPAPTFNGASATPVDNLYVAGTIPVLTSATNGARRTFSFTPPVPITPTGLNFTAVSATSITVNWTDTSSDEDLFAIYRSTDGINYTYIGAAAENATSFVDSSLAPSTNYFYQVYAVSEGALSAALSGSQASGAPGNDTCNGAGGNWSSTASWTDGSVPTSADNVTIGTGCTITVDITTAAALNVTINAGGTLQSPTLGAIINNNLTVGGNLTNNGTLDFSTNGDTSAAILTFGAGATNVTFGGTGATTDVRAITVAKGAQATVVELNTTNFTVRGVNTDVAGYLTLTSGTFKISGTFTMANRTFLGPTYVIPALGGFWLNNPNYTVAATASGTTTGNSGLLRLTQGIYNLGLTGADGFQAGAAGATYIIEGATLNANGRFDPQSALTFTMSSGTINAGVVGNTVSSFGTFELFSSTNTINISGGNINIARPSTAATKDDYVLRGTAANVSITGGTLTFGTLAAGTFITPFGTTFAPNVVINAGSTWNINNVGLFFRGATLVNNGAITSTGTSARFDFQSLTGAMSYSGTGTFGTLAVPFGGVGISSNSLFLTTLNSPIFVNRVNLFTGGFINSNQITLGQGGATTTVVQTGSAGLLTPGGSFDVSPVHNQGTGGQVLLYLQESVMRTTGFEVNPTRTLNTLIVGTTNNVTLAGGNLTINSTAAGALTLTDGILFTNAANTLIHTGTGTNVRTNGYVDGPLQRPFAAAGAYTFFVGEGGYSPVLATVTAVTTPGSLTAEAFDATLQGFNPPTSLSRNWSLTEVGDITADLSFTYIEADTPNIAINTDEDDYRVYRRENPPANTVTNLCPGAPCVNTTTNVLGPVTGVTTFSRWTGANLQVPVAANVDIGGRALMADGITPMSRARITLTGGGLSQPVTVLTNPFGYYIFSGFPTGRTYVLTANRKGYSFINPTIVLNPEDNIYNADFIASPLVNP